MFPINLTNFLFIIGHISYNFENQKTKKQKTTVIPNGPYDFHFLVVSFQNHHVPIDLTKFVFIIRHILYDFENKKQKSENHINIERAFYSLNIR